MHINRRFIFYALGVLSIIILLYFLFIYNNIHTVIPNQVYRSDELNPKALKVFVKQYHIQAIINLEDRKETKNINNEIVFAKQKHVKFYLIPFPAKGLPEVEKFKLLVDVLQKSPRPLLIHCKHGSDRTGLASAIILILDEQAPLSVAYAQIAWWYGAVSPQSVGRLVMNMYANWLKEEKLPDNRTNFLAWVAQLKLMGGFWASHPNPTATELKNHQQKEMETKVYS